jgi:hypothetical protein
MFEDRGGVDVDPETIFDVTAQQHGVERFQPKLHE